MGRRTKRWLFSYTSTSNIVYPVIWLEFLFINEWHIAYFFIHLWLYLILRKQAPVLSYKQLYTFSIMKNVATEFTCESADIGDY